MADSEILKTIKDISLKIQTASLKERREVLEEICNVLDSEGITEQVVRYICRLLPSTIHRYRDTTSQSYVKCLIVHLIKKHKGWVLTCLPPVLLELSENQFRLTPSKYTSQSGLYALRWSTTFVENGLKAPADVDVDYGTIILTQANLLATVTAFGNLKTNEKAYSTLEECWRAIPPEILQKWLDTLVAISDPSPAAVVMLSALCRYYTARGERDKCLQHKPKILELFTKSLINVKSRPNSNQIKACKDLLGLINQEDLKDVLLPALHKALLRSPEIIIEAVGEVFSTLSLELNETVLDVGKSLIGNLQSNDETVREAALITLRRLSAQVQCTRTAEALLKYIFAFYNGASGKLTSPEHKIAVLTGAGILSTAGAAKESVTTNAHASFVRVLEAETHERTLCAALQALSTTKGPHLLNEHIQLFQKNLGLKSSTPLVRIAYMQFLAVVIQDAKVETAVIDKLWPILTKSVEKAVQQPLQQFVVSEAISAMRVLVQLDVTRALSGRGSSSLPLLLHERSLLTTPDVLIQVAWLCASLLNYQPISTDKESPVYRATIITLLTPATQVRTSSKQIIKQLLNNRKNSLIAKSLVLKLNEVLDEGKVFLAKEKSPSDDKSEVTGKMVLDCVDVLCSCTEYPIEDLERLVIEALPSYHHPLSMSTNRTSWRSLLKRMHLDGNTLVRKHGEVLKKLYISGYKPNNETVSNIVSTLVRINSDVIVPTLVQIVLDNITDPSLLKVTRDEYFTYLTPEDELYDKSVVPGNESSKEMNLKRESKAYSYKDQLEELQLRREMEEKRKSEGKQVQVQLSAKQKEAIKAQQAKEAIVRERLTVLNNQVLIAIGLTESAFRGAPLALSLCMRTLLPPLLSSLQSPLAAPLVAALHVRLRNVLPPQHDVLAHTTARVTLRLYKPQCDLDPSWDVEPLIEVTSRTILMLQGVAAAMKSEDDSDDMLNDVDDDNFTTKAGFNAPSFCYIFPLLDKGLTFAKSEGIIRNNELILTGVQLLSQHGGLRATLPTDPYNPKYLPLDHMFRLLLDLIGSTDGRTQSRSVAALLDVAAAASGAPGCCRATIREIDVLLDGLQHTAASVRDAALCCLQVLTDVLPDLLDDPLTSLQLTERLLLAKFDVVAENRQSGEKLFESIISAELEEQQWEGLQLAALSELQHTSEPIQHAAAAALAHLLKSRPHTAETALEAIMALYDDMLPLIPAKHDQFGHIVVEAIDNWTARRGAALALTALAQVLDEALVSRAVLFLVNKGLADREAAVREHMLRAAMALVDEHGKATISSQLPIYENFLDTAPKSGGYDAVRQSVVLIIGALARHLEPDDARIRPITLRLVASLNTPSQQVQEAVGNSLPHLVTSPVMKEEIPAIVAKLMKQLLTAEKYGDRKGASYGIAGIVKGLGILALKQLDIMTKLTEAIQEKKNYKFKEGALFALEMLCLKLGRLFEPYIVHVLPHLLLCFGDGSQYVRTAADDTAKLIMSKLSAHGVKLVLPSLLQALHDDNWRTKTGSIELLGAMAYCAPKQLSSCLPSIVPKLIEVLSDSHTKVQAAAAEALRVIGSVIRNPEIQAIVPVLLQALQDPSNKTSACLQTLLDTKFVHFIDAPSLALIMPVVQRAFLDRSTETRKMAAQIIGNMYSLTDQKDLMPYLPSIIPGLKTSLLDPVPEVRSVSARALGAMVRGMGEQSFEELLPWLMQTLTSEASSVDRSGAAQGLSEVVAGLGVHKLHDLMPDIISTAERTDIAPHVKDGYIMMFIYMPGAFTSEFTHYIGQIINPILKALADENEYVRDTALKAGQRIVTLYADSAITLLLPELEKGLFDDNWRIRYSSVQLLGDLLYRISGVSGKMSTETACEDDNFGTEQSHQAIMRALGAERRNRVLAGLYMGRSDVALMVRQAALHVWKVVVTNTPKTLREILPTLFSLLLGCLASTSYDKRQVAARTLGDLVRKLGERVLPEIVPILERGLLSDRPDQRQGVCIGLGEIIASTSRDTVLTFADGLVPTVRKALCDPLPEVRMAAARTFDSLHATIGSKALDDILPSMLEGLHDPDVAVSEATLDGLRQVMAIKSRAVLPYLIPQLTSTPPNTRALSALASAAGDALVKHLHKILPALLMALEGAHGTARETKELENCRGALLPVLDEGGVRSIVDYLLESTRSTNASRKRASTTLLCAFVSHTRADLAPHVTQLLRGLIHMMAVDDQETLQMAWEALNSLTKSMDAEQQIAHVSDVRQAVRFVTSDLKGDLLPGFCLPKGIAPILPLFRESILNGMPDDKESAAIMLGEIIKVTAAASIQPSVVHVTGPLIRILGDRFNANVKAAVLETLAILLAKVGAMLKQFLPQLQTTFLKSLTDPSRNVRMKAGSALSHLVVIHTRADPLFVEVHNGIKNSEDIAVRETMLQALRNIVSVGGVKMTDPLKLTILTTLTNPAYLSHADDPPRGPVGGCLGSLLHCLPPTHLEAALVHHVLATDCDWPLIHGRSCALFVCLKEKPSSIYLDEFSEKIHRTLQVYLNHDKVPVVCNAVRSLAYLISYLVENDLPIHSFVLSSFAKVMSHQNNEVKQLMARACAIVPRARSDDTARTVLKALLPALLLGARDKNSYVRANAELGLRALYRSHPEICNSVLDESGRAALAEAEAKATRRGAPDQPEELDHTILT